MTTNIAASQPPFPPGKRWQPVHTLIAGGLILAIGGMAGFSGFTWPTHPQSNIITWWAIMLILTAFIFAAGHGITGRWLGALIDERNKMSLSRLQLLLWTILILSAYLTAVIWNLVNKAPESLAIALPPELWALLGISTTSLVASPLILSTKKSRTAKQNEFERNKKLADKQKGVRVSFTPAKGNPNVAFAPAPEFGGTSEPNTPATPAAQTESLEPYNEGQVVFNPDPQLASISDLFMGDETGNFPHLDLGKIQMLYFTLIVVLGYGIALGGTFLGTTLNEGNPIKAFPILSESIVALLGISHAGYLANKAVPHSTPADTEG